jgi:hypothetical protein
MNNSIHSDTLIGDYRAEDTDICLGSSSIFLVSIAVMEYSVAINELGAYRILLD